MKVLLFFVVLIILLVSATLTGGGFYKGTLHSVQVAKISQLLDDQSVSNKRVELSYLDTKIYGVVSTFDHRIKVARSVNGLRGVRLAKGGNNLKVDAKLELEKIKNSLVLSGQLSSLQRLKNLSDSFSLKKDQYLKENEVYLDSKMLQNTQFLTWLNRFFCYQGEKSIVLNNDKITVAGTVTEPLQRKILKELREMRMTVSNRFTLVDSESAEFFIKKNNDRISGSGRIPIDFLPESIGVENIDGITYDPFIHARASLENETFCRWATEYFSKKGNRSFRIENRRVTLAGSCTPALSLQWIEKLTSLNFQVSNELSVYPSIYHYPSYLIESDVSGEFIRLFNKVSDGSEIIFNTTQGQFSKRVGLDAICSVIKSEKVDHQFVVCFDKIDSQNVKTFKKAIEEELLTRGIRQQQLHFERFESESRPSLDSHEIALEILIK